MEEVGLEELSEQSSSSVTVTVKQSFSDFYALQTRFIVRKLWWMPLGMSLAPVTWQFWENTVVAVVICFLFGCGIILILPFIQWRSAKKDNPNFGGPTEYTFSDKGISLQLPVTNVSYDWAAFKRIEETDKYLLSHFASGAFYFIPKRELRDEALRKVKSILSTYPPVGLRLNNEAVAQQK